MCGIIGWYSRNSDVDIDIITRMMRSIAHRGPDGAGYWLEHDRSIGLGHLRLSIIDLAESASQPMRSIDTSTVIVFNGEIYNHAELRKQLISMGSQFITDHSDTEVILNGYRAWGFRKLLDKLVGIFAIAIYDRRTRKIYAARDHIGVKPFYYYYDNVNFLFASEVKALLQHPLIKPQLNKETFYHHLSFRSLPAPYTLFKNIRKLGPSEYIEFSVNPKSFKVHEYWNPLSPRSSLSTMAADPVDSVAELLDSSIKNQLVSDVPVGVFLSGGIDSAYLTQQAVQHLDTIDTFTVGYPGHAEYDESNIAEELARKLGTRHHQVPLGSDSYVSAMLDVTYFQDEPISAPVCVPVYMLSKAARNSNIPVILAGEGSDEIFIGYTNWLRLRNLQKLDQLSPDIARNLLRKTAYGVVSRLLNTYSPIPEILRRSANSQPLFWAGAMDFSEQAKILLLGSDKAYSHLNTYKDCIEPIYNKYLSYRSSSDITGWMSYADIKFRLPELMLPRLDKMGMAHSIEGRVPFLDHNLVELALNLPQKLRVESGKITKPVFKSIASRHLPENFVMQRKRGFQAPVKEWKEESFGRQYLPALIDFSKRSGLFSHSALNRLLSRSGDRLYYSLINFMLWYCIYIDNILSDHLPELSMKQWSIDSFNINTCILESTP